MDTLLGIGCGLLIGGLVVYVALMIYFKDVYR